MKNPATALVRRLVNARAHKYASYMEVERAERLFYLKYLRAGMTVFDVGAHVGELTLMFSRFVGHEGCVHAFEPSGAGFAKLSTICAAASLANVQLQPVALADQEGTVLLYSYGDDYLSWTSQALRPLETYGINVRSVSNEEALCITLDLYCERNSVASIDLLKIDVEGAEFQVLLGARRMLEAGRIKCIAFEFGQTTFDMNNDPTDIEEYLKDLGYILQNVVASDPVFPGRESPRTACFSMTLATPAGVKIQ